MVYVKIYSRMTNTTKTIKWVRIMNLFNTFPMFRIEVGVVEVAHSLFGMTFLPCNPNIATVNRFVRVPEPLTQVLPVPKDTSTGEVYRLLSEMFGDDIFLGCLMCIKVCSGLALPDKFSTLLRTTSLYFKREPRENFT